MKIVKLVGLGGNNVVGIGEFGASAAEGGLKIRKR